MGVAKKNQCNAECVATAVTAYVNTLTVKFLPAGELVGECVLVSRQWETVYGESTPGNYKQMTSLTFGASLVF